MIGTLCNARQHCFDSHLAQADSLRALFVGLNDEVKDVCATTIQLVGRLANRNPAYVLPALRRHLLQLLNELEHSSDMYLPEESARLLGILIRSCSRLILPYVSPILKALMTKLRASSEMAGAPPKPPPPPDQAWDAKAQAQARISSVAKAAGGSGRHLQVSVLATIGSLARVSGATMRPYMRELLPLLLYALRDSTTLAKRTVAVATLGMLVQSSGYVIKPYVEYPQLMSMLLRLLNEMEATRREVLKTLGIIGALDPHTHKLTQFSLKVCAYRSC